MKIRKCTPSKKLDVKLKTVDSDVIPKPVVTRNHTEVMSREANAGLSNDSSSTHEDSIVLSDTFFVNLNSDSEETSEISDCCCVEKKYVCSEDNVEQVV